jgi:hypothetical protein
MTNPNAPEHPVSARTTLRLNVEEVLARIEKLETEVRDIKQARATEGQELRKIADLLGDAIKRIEGR